MTKIQEILEGVGGLVNTFDNKRIGVSLLILFCVLGFSGYLNYTFYNQVISLNSKMIDSKIMDYKEYNAGLKACTDQRDSLRIINSILVIENNKLLKKH